MSNVLPRLIENTVGKLTHLTCNSPRTTRARPTHHTHHTQLPPPTPPPRPQNENMVRTNSHICQNYGICKIDGLSSEIITLLKGRPSYSTRYSIHPLFHPSYLNYSRASSQLFTCLSHIFEEEINRRGGWQQSTASIRQNIVRLRACVRNRCGRMARLACGRSRREVQSPTERLPPCP